MTAIRRGLLSELFEGVVAKRLTLVETITPNSNQHEFQGIKPLRELFGLEDRKNIPARFVWLGEEQSALSEDGFISWSNVRKGKPRTPEYHLYYSGNAVTEVMKPGDTLFLAMRPEGSAMVIIAPENSTMQSQLLWLFGMSEQATTRFEFRDISHDISAELDFAARYILDELGLELEEPEVDRIDGLLEKFGMNFPSTKIFSALAQSSMAHVNPLDDPDKVLMAWIEQEELLFRHLERRIISVRLRTGFTAGQEVDVDGFISFSLQVQNRRKSRAGHSLEHHLEALFAARKIKFTRNAQTENFNKPDFLFPGVSEYKDLEFPVERLTVLASKSSLKDRWRQVLPETKRIQQKHLVTLEPGISPRQTDQMQMEHVQLVIPASIHASYREIQRSWLLKVSDFIELVKAREKA